MTTELDAQFAALEATLTNRRDVLRAELADIDARLRKLRPPVKRGPRKPKTDATANPLPNAPMLPMGEPDMSEPVKDRIAAVAAESADEPEPLAEPVSDPWPAALVALPVPAPDLRSEWPTPSEARRQQRGSSR